MAKTKNKLTGQAKAAFLKRMAAGRRKGAKKKNRNPNGCETGSTLQLVPNRNGKKKKRNPDFLAGLLGSPRQIAIGAVSGLGSAVITRQLPQWVLKANNAGWKGYLANGVAGAAATYLAGRLAGPDAAKAALVGATVILLDRILTEKVSPLGQYLALSGSGDATATGTLGTIADGYFIHPTIVDRTGRPVIPHEITDAALAAVLNKYPQLAAPQPANRTPARNGAMAGVGGNRFRTRFAA